MHVHVIYINVHMQKNTHTHISIYISIVHWCPRRHRSFEPNWRNRFTTIQTQELNKAVLYSEPQLLSEMKKKERGVRVRVDGRMCASVRLTRLLISQCQAESAGVHTWKITGQSPFYSQCAIGFDSLPLLLSSSSIHMNGHFSYTCSLAQNLLCVQKGLFYAC